MIEEKLYAKAVIVFGSEDQKDQAKEECAELILALSHYRRGRVKASHVCEEIADVEIMMGQLRKIFGEAKVDRAKKEKLERLEKTIHATLCVRENRGLYS